MAGLALLMLLFRLGDVNVQRAAQAARNVCAAAQVGLRIGILGVRAETYTHKTA